MVKTYSNPVYPYKTSADQHAVQPTHHPVVIVGAGPAGLAAAIDLAIQGIASVVLDDNNTVSVGSRAICFAKRTLEICDRYTTADRMLAKGITWNLGKVYWQEHLIYEFNLLPEKGHKMPAFINLQQYYFEEYMVERCNQLHHIDLRWLSTVSNVKSYSDKTTLDVSTEEGTYSLSCDYLLVADGANSSIRNQFDLPFNGQVFQDRFLIADIVMKANFPAERRFWFDAPFHPNQSTLLHKQADNVWRIDFQLGWEANVEEENKPEKIIPRIKAMLGENTEFELEWTSIYTFRCRKMDNFIHERIIFMGDAAHQVSPFGARGGNGAIQAVDNLCWKLASVIKQQAPAELISTYNDERQKGAEENLMHSARSTDFMTPKNAISKAFQKTVLELSEQYPFARTLVNSGRLSTPCIYQHSPLNTEDTDTFKLLMQPGSACIDAPINYQGENHWLLNFLGNQFVCMIDTNVEDTVLLAKEIQALKDKQSELRLLLLNADETISQQFSKEWIVSDDDNIVNKRYGLSPGNAYLIRPDQHVCARWRSLTSDAVIKAYKKSLGFELENIA